MCTNNKKYNGNFKSPHHLIKVHKKKLRQTLKSKN